MAQGERSSMPMILGIIGGVAGFPAAMCSGACAVFIEGASGGSDASAQSAGNTFLVLGLIGAVGGLIFGILAKRKPVLAGIGMILAAILAGITIFAANFLALIPTTCFIVGGAIALANKNKPAPGHATQS